MTHPTREGHVTVPGGNVWYQIVGTGDAVPLLVLHGGPGLGCDYLEPLAALASDHPVVFFDQLGCGKSDQPGDVSLWRIGRYVEEVAAVRKALDLGRIHLFGHSWGGWLAIEYMLRKPSGIVSLILASTSASLRQFARETAHLKSLLPQEIQDTLNRCDAVDDTHSSEYQEAMMAFYTRHVCRLNTWPEPLMRSLKNITGNPVPYEETIGPNLFTIAGNLKDWDRTNQIGEITVPTLITCGRYDEIGPACATTLHDIVPNSEMHVFERSSHMSHLEETELYLQGVSSFLRKINEQVK